MQPITVLLLAGHRSTPGLLCDAYHEKYKSLIPVAGLPMILHPLKSLAAHTRVAEILVLAQEPEKLHKALSGHQPGNKVRFVKSSGSIANTVLSCINDYKLNYPILITTADNCLLGVEDIEEFLDKAYKDPSDISVAFASKQNVLAAFPQVRRTWIPFRDTELTGCNLFLLKNARSGELIRFWQTYENSPKKFLKLAMALGPGFFWSFIRKKLTMSEAFSRLSTIAGATVSPVLLDNPQVSIDADKYTDILQIDQILNKTGKAYSQRLPIEETNGPVVIFDLDRTITRGGTYTPFLAYYALNKQPWRLLFAPIIVILMLCYVLKLLDRKQLKSSMFGLLIGKPGQKELENVCQAFVDETLDKHVYPEALYTIREWQKKNARLVLATASYDWMATLFASRLMIDTVIATRSFVKNGKVVAGVVGENCYGQAKRTMIYDAIGPLLNSVDHPRDIWFYTDHHSDIPMLSSCNHPVGVNTTHKLANWIKSRPDGLLLDWYTPRTQFAVK